MWFELATLTSQALKYDVITYTTHMKVVYGKDPFSAKNQTLQDLRVYISPTMHRRSHGGQRGHSPPPNF